ncbi:MAG: 50S ribosomal protein L18Ae [Candidatus Thalassarchaeaceae archaeon]|jgi:large subunit ribosomal protein LX
MKAYRAKGTFRNGKHDQPYTLDIVASDDEDAKHRIYSNFGSRHNASRRFIQIDSLEIIDPSESNAAAVIAHFRD